MPLACRLPDAWRSQWNHDRSALQLCCATCCRPCSFRTCSSLSSSSRTWLSIAWRFVAYLHCDCFDNGWIGGHAIVIQYLEICLWPMHMVLRISICHEVGANISMNVWICIDRRSVCIRGNNTPIVWHVDQGLFGGTVTRVGIANAIAPHIWMDAVEICWRASVWVRSPEEIIHFVGGWQLRNKHAVLFEVISCEVGRGIIVDIGLSDIVVLKVSARGLLMRCYAPAG